MDRAQMPDITPEGLTTREEFLVFVQRLRRDLVTDNHAANVTLDDFLEALAAWAKDSDQKALPESWRLAAKLLLAGLLYE